MYDLIIIGSGPAGLSAAVYAKRAGLETLVVEKSSVSGGQVLNTYEVDNYLGLPGINGYDMGVKFREHADAMEIPFMTADVKSVEPAGDPEALLRASEQTPAAYCVRTNKGDLEAKTILIATGANHAKLGVPGEAELSGKGVSYCATCDGAFFRNRTVAVVGGGDVAVEDAVFLARTSKKVYLIHRRDELRAAKILQESLFRLPNVEVIWDTVVEEIRGENRVENLCLKNRKTGETSTLETDGVFIAVGIHPNTEIFREVVECDAQGYVLAGEDCTTDQPGIFVAGDARQKPLRQIITAVADGANAVTSIQEYFIGCE